METVRSALSLAPSCSASAVPTEGTRTVRVRVGGAHAGTRTVAASPTEVVADGSLPDAVVAFAVASDETRAAAGRRPEVPPNLVVTPTITLAVQVATSATGAVGEVHRNRLARASAVVIASVAANSLVSSGTSV